MNKYQNIYPIKQEFSTDIEGNINFTENDDDTYIDCKNNCSIYRFDNKNLVISFKYSQIMQTEGIKATHKEIYKLIKKTVKVIDEDLFSDGIEFRFAEVDLEKVIECMGKKYEPYYKNKNRPIKSVMNLPDYKERKHNFETVKHNVSLKKLNNLIEIWAEKNNMTKLVAWKKLYIEFKNKHNIDISLLAEENGVRPIHIIDNKNYYSKIFKIIE